MFSLLSNRRSVQFYSPQVSFYKVLVMLPTNCKLISQLCNLLSINQLYLNFRNSHEMIEIRHTSRA